MKLLLLILSIMTFTVETKSRVNAEGTWPYDMEAVYACTYQKGDVRAGDTATLSLSGLEGITVEKVDVYMKSNKTAGAGVITMTADGQQIYRNEGTYKDWFGAYDNTNYQAIGWSGNQNVNALEVQVVGTTNSLHIEKYEITYSQAEVQEYSVILMKGDEPIDTLIGKTVDLPQWENEGNWKHVGWTETPFQQQEIFPEGVAPGSSYTPTKDVRLWAVYAYEQSWEDMIAAELGTGYYIYANLADTMAMSGPAKADMASVTINLYDQSQYYFVQFLTDTTAILKVSEDDEQYIGPIGNTMVRMQQKPYTWKVYHEGTKTAFYTEENYVIMPGMMKIDEITDEVSFITKLWKTDDISGTTTALIEVPQSGTPILTCYPEYGLGITNERVNELTNERVVPFGIYNLKIINGRKYLELR